MKSALALMAGATRLSNWPTTEVGTLLYQLAVVVALAIWLKRMVGVFPAAARTEEGATDATALTAAIQVGFAVTAAASALILDT